jgi:hypothetical protein
MIEFFLSLFCISFFVRVVRSFILFVLFLSLRVTIIGFNFTIRLFLLHMPMRGHIDQVFCFPFFWPLFVCLLSVCCVRGLLTIVDSFLFGAFYIYICLKSVGSVTFLPVAVQC